MQYSSPAGVMAPSVLDGRFVRKRNRNCRSKKKKIGRNHKGYKQKGVWKYVHVQYLPNINVLNSKDGVIPVSDIPPVGDFAEVLHTSDDIAKTASPPNVPGVSDILPDGVCCSLDISATEMDGVWSLLKLSQYQSDDFRLPLAFDSFETCSKLGAARARSGPPTAGRVE